MDKIEKLFGSTIQHGPHNKRIYLMKLDRRRDDLDSLLAALDKLAIRNVYTKIFAKIPAALGEKFAGAGYIREAVVPNLFKGSEDCYFMAKFLSNKRHDSPDERLAGLIHERTVPPKNAENGKDRHREEHQVHLCTPSDALEMCDIYRQVFASYPFPIKDPRYLARTMMENVRYYCIAAQGERAALASAELDQDEKNAEMTDFATLPKYRGRGLAAALLNHMDKEMADGGIKTTYTIARAQSSAMNMVFKRCGYTYAGFLANNSQIAGEIQSMTVWYKNLG